MSERTVVSYKGINPQIASNVYLAEGARIVGIVEIEEDCGIWFNTVIRGDVDKVVIGKGTNIQDKSTVHVAKGNPCIVGKGNTVGHKVLLHGCTVGDNCLIGMGAILLNGSEVGDNSIVAAGAILTQNKKFPSGVLIMGAPAKVIRELTSEEIAGISKSTESYRERAQEYKSDQ